MVSIPGYDGVSGRYQFRGTRVLIPGYEGISGRYQFRGTRVLIPGYEGISGRFQFRGTRVLIPGTRISYLGYESYKRVFFKCICDGVRGY